MAKLSTTISIIGFTAGGIAGILSLLNRDKTQTEQLAADQLASVEHGVIKQSRKDIKSRKGRVDEVLRIVNDNIDDPDVYTWTRSVLTKNGVKGRDDLGEVKCLFNAIRSRVEYRSDIRGVDTHARGGITLSVGGGDCDDFTILSLQALEGLGYTTRLCLIDLVDGTVHVFAQVGLPKGNPKKFYNFDPSLPGKVAKFGWEVPKNLITAKNIYDTRTTKEVKDG
jgi:hypothetical protein